MRYIRILPVACAVLLLAGCAAPKTITAPAPTPSDNPSVSLTPPTSDTTTSTPSQGASTNPEPLQRLAAFTYRSGQPNSTLEFTAPVTGYRYVYKCTLDPATPADVIKQGVTTGYGETINEETVSHDQGLICDNNKHTIKVTAAQVSADNSGNQRISLTLTGDRMWVDKVDLEALG